MLLRMKYYLQRGLPLSYHSASLFQGALMQRIDPAYGEVLHRSELKPYSQYLTFHKGRPVWVLQLLTDEAASHLLAPPQLTAGSTILLERLDLQVEIAAVSQDRLTHEELLQRTFFASCPRTIKIRFATPTAFKVQGRYQIYPTIRHIFGSLIQKYDAVYTQTEIMEDGLLEDLQKLISVIGYDLRSTSFSVEGVTIPSFMGTLLLKIAGPQQLVNLVHLLQRFGTYAGVGIKTAMGMGALQVIERSDIQNARKSMPDCHRRTAP